MTSKVAVINLDGNVAESFNQTLRQIGGKDDLNSADRSVVIKVGVFSHKAENHSSVSVVDAIIDCFDKAPKIFLAESDNYQGTGSERLQIWKTLFTDKVVPFNLSSDSNTRKVKHANQEMDLSHILFKPNILVDTHILRTFERGSILKNLFGCIPTPKKSKFHKGEIFFPLLADIYETIGGIDLAMLYGTYFWGGAGYVPLRMNILLVGRDAAAVETVGATLAGLHPEKMPLIQEFVKRGLGKGDLYEIEIVEAFFESLKERFASAAKLLEKRWRERGGAPEIWSPEIDSLIREGFFKLPNRRTRKEVKKALENKSIQTKGNIGVIATTLARKIKEGVLRATKNPDGWIYWAE